MVDVVAPAVKPVVSDRANAVKEQCFTAIAGWLGASRCVCTDQEEPALPDDAPSIRMLMCRLDCSTAQDGGSSDLTASQHRSVFKHHDLPVVCIMLCGTVIAALRV